MHRMEWKRTVNHHDLMVKEIMVETYFALRIECLTCGLVLGTLDEKCFPRFPLAWQTAWDWGTRHAWHGPNHGPDE